MAEISQSLLAAATKCFLENGYEATTLQAIANEAGISKVTLYARFPNKETLFKAVLEDRLNAWSAATEAHRWSQGRTPEERLRALVRVVVTYRASDQAQALHRLLAGAPPKVAAGFATIHTRRTISLLARELAALAQRGHTRKRTIRVATELMSLLHGWCWLKATEGSLSEREAVAFGNRAVDLILAARNAW